MQASLSELWPAASGEPGRDSAPCAGETTGSRAGGSAPLSSGGCALTVDCDAAAREDEPRSAAAALPEEIDEEPSALCSTCAAKKAGLSRTGRKCTCDSGVTIKRNRARSTRREEILQRDRFGILWADVERHGNRTARPSAVPPAIHVPDPNAMLERIREVLVDAGHDRELLPLRVLSLDAALPELRCYNLWDVGYVCSDDRENLNWHYEQHMERLHFEGAMSRAAVSLERARLQLECRGHFWDEPFDVQLQISGCHQLISTRMAQIRDWREAEFEASQLHEVVEGYGAFWISDGEVPPWPTPDGFWCTAQYQEHERDPFIESVDELITACHAADTTTVRTLIEGSILGTLCANATGLRCLKRFRCITCGNAKGHGCDLWAQGCFSWRLVLAEAAQAGSVEVMRLLLPVGGSDSLSWLCDYSDPIERPTAHPPEDGETECIPNPAPMLYIAAAYGHSALVQFLIDEKANPGQTASDGTTPVHAACRFNEMDTLRLLDKNGAHLAFFLTRKDKDGAAPLHLAALNGNVDALKYLASQGVSMMTKGTVFLDGDFTKGLVDVTPLDIARHKGHASIIEFLSPAGETSSRPKHARSAQTLKQRAVAVGVEHRLQEIPKLLRLAAGDGDDSAKKKVQRIQKSNSQVVARAEKAARGKNAAAVSLFREST